MIACVLRSGGDYDHTWVYALKRGLVAVGYEGPFRVLTDSLLFPASWTIPLVHRWPGWWSKLELFRPDLFDEPVLYLDLDTLVLGDIKPLLDYAGRFAALSDFRRPERIQTAVMAWTPSSTTEAIYERAKEDESVMSSYWSDQPYIEAVMKYADRLQDYCGGLYSLKVDALKGPPDDAVLVCGHGQPRFSDPKAGWAHEAWKSCRIAV